MAAKNRDAQGDSLEYDNEGYRHSRTCPRVAPSPFVILPSMPRSVNCALPLLLKGKVIPLLARCGPEGG
jgi:hypothetical protein